ncbi:hypothetical protein EDB81DRAFT_374993 [Dactylonectria macrodidyma]|uniref:Uncharacterized protein n=1 Tax=Dactylonectria macrodidyma TaxID=307937 RepID=A0A9P9I7Y6_9HYPO|nr:hypothetical protein EDB81DRAFT_374993 [Dactylonectria macrodidyma]
MGYRDRFRAGAQLRRSTGLLPCLAVTCLDACPAFVLVLAFSGLFQQFPQLPKTRFLPHLPREIHISYGPARFVDSHFSYNFPYASAPEHPRTTMPRGSRSGKGRKGGKGTSGTAPAPNDAPAPNGGGSASNDSGRACSELPDFQPWVPPTILAGRPRTLAFTAIGSRTWS